MAASSGAGEAAPGTSVSTTIGLSVVFGILAIGFTLFVVFWLLKKPKECMSDRRKGDQVGLDRGGRHLGAVLTHAIHPGFNGGARELPQNIRAYSKPRPEQHIDGKVRVTNIWAGEDHECIREAGRLLYHFLPLSLVPDLQGKEDLALEGESISGLLVQAPHHNRGQEDIATPDAVGMHPDKG
ncbi:MAG: hypothetical protein M1827_002582 [Pycnora praestabilis]|nr:MAG: hypothetical protein M1827_002582 [Pycnora praestabilis]